MTVENSFRGANLSGIANKGVLALCTEVLKFRKQLTLRSELREQSGWNDELNAYLTDSLNALCETLEGVTYTAMQQPVATLMPSPIPVTFPYVLDGSHPDYPQLDAEAYQNDWLKMFIWELDHTFAEATRLDCRHSGYTVPKTQSVMIKGMLNNLMQIVQAKGGEGNRVNTPTGTLPSQEADTFQGNSQGGGPIII